MDELSQQRKSAAGSPRAVRRNHGLGTERPGKLLRRFAIPTIISMVVNSLYNVVDQVMIGWKVGILGNAATNVAFPLSTICLAISLLIGVGAAARFSLELGKQNRDNAEKCVGDAVWMCAIFGVLFALFVIILKTPIVYAFGATQEIYPYAISYVSITAFGMPAMIFVTVMSNLIRADGSPRWSMVVMAVGAVVNIGLDALFMFGFGMGMEGAAIATVLSQFLSAALAASYLPRFRSIRLQRSSFHPEIRRCLRMCGYGAGNSLNQCCLSVVQVLFNNALGIYGAASIYGADISIAAMGVVMKVNGIVVAVMVGLATGAQPILGYNRGAGLHDRVRKTYWITVGTGMILGAAAVFVFEVFPEYLISMFGSGNALYMEFAVFFMRTFLVLTPFAGVYLITMNFFTAIGKPLKGMLISLTRQVGLYVPMIFLLPFLFGVKGVAFVGPVSDTGVAIVSFILVTRELSKSKAAVYDHS